MQVLFFGSSPLYGPKITNALHERPRGLAVARVVRAPRCLWYPRRRPPPATRHVPTLLPLPRRTLVRVTGRSLGIPILLEYLLLLYVALVVLLVRLLLLVVAPVRSLGRAPGGRRWRTAAAEAARGVLLKLARGCGDGGGESNSSCDSLSLSS